jgi:catechol 2,3-dioxygenase-like lactoylglutathione lyase family enzyme
MRPRRIVPSSLALAALLAGLAAGPAARAAPGPLADVKLAQITLPAKDLALSVAFYRDVLGVRLLFQVKGAAFFDAGGVRLRLEESQTAAPTGAVELYFDDPGLARAGPLTARGVTFRRPAGNRAAARQNRPEAAGIHRPRRQCPGSDGRGSALGS